MEEKKKLANKLDYVDRCTVVDWKLALFYLSISDDRSVRGLDLRLGGCRQKCRLVYRASVRWRRPVGEFPWLATRHLWLNPRQRYAIGRSVDPRPYRNFLFVLFVRLLSLSFVCFYRESPPHGRRSPTRFFFSFFPLYQYLDVFSS